MITATKVITCKATRNGVDWHLGRFHSEQEAREYAQSIGIGNDWELVFGSYFEDYNGKKIDYSNYETDH